MLKDSPHTGPVKPSSAPYSRRTPAPGAATPLVTDLQQDSQTRTGWFRAMRSCEATELIRANPNAFILAYIIASRGQYRPGFNQYNLGLGEAMLGDYENYRMSEGEYRTAKRQLAKWGFATFRKTNKGTIGKLIDTRLFAILRLEDHGQKDTRATDRRQTGDGQATTTKNIRAEELKERKEVAYSHLAPLGSARRPIAQTPAAPAVATASSRIKPEDI
jgi:hypothetical protein